MVHRRLPKNEQWKSDVFNRVIAMYVQEEFPTIENKFEEEEEELCLIR